MTAAFILSVSRRGTAKAKLVLNKEFLSLVNGHVGLTLVISVLTFAENTTRFPFLFLTPLANSSCKPISLSLSWITSYFPFPGYISLQQLLQTIN